MFADTQMDPTVDATGPTTHASPRGFRFRKDTTSTLMAGIDLYDMVNNYCEDLKTLDKELRATPGRVMPMSDLHSSKYAAKVSSGSLYTS